MLMENFVILTVKKILVAKYVLFCDAVTNVRKNMGVGVCLLYTSDAADE